VDMSNDFPTHAAVANRSAAVSFLHGDGLHPNRHGEAAIAQRYDAAVRHVVFDLWREPPANVAAPDCPVAAPRRDPVVRLGDGGLPARQTAAAREADDASIGLGTPALVACAAAVLSASCVLRRRRRCPS